MDYIKPVINFVNPAAHYRAICSDIGELTSLYKEGSDATLLQKFAMIGKVFFKAVALMTLVGAIGLVLTASPIAIHPISIALAAVAIVGMILAYYLGVYADGQKTDATTPPVHPVKLKSKPQQLPLTQDNIVRVLEPCGFDKLLKRMQADMEELKLEDDNASIPPSATSADFPDLCEFAPENERIQIRMKELEEYEPKEDTSACCSPQNEPKVIWHGAFMHDTDDLTSQSLTTYIPMQQMINDQNNNGGSSDFPENGSTFSYYSAPENEVNLTRNPSLSRSSSLYCDAMQEQGSSTNSYYSPIAGTFSITSHGEYLTPSSTMNDLQFPLTPHPAAINLDDLSDQELDEIINFNPSIELPLTPSYVSQSV